MERRPEREGEMKHAGMAPPSSSGPAPDSSWFNNPAVPPPPASEPAPHSLPPLPPLSGDPVWALALGAVSGGVGGAAMVFVGAEVARRLRLDVDIIRTIGRAARVLGDDPFVVGLGVPVAAGSLVGVLFGALMRHSLRLIARVLAGVLLAVGLWTFVHAFVLTPFTASLGALPIVPMVAGAAVFGLCVALLRPPRVRARTRA